MSWQRILRFAKQRQVPVIITDESGEDPLILLSLDQLEQALDGGVTPDLPTPPPVPRPTTPSFVPEATPFDEESVQTSPQSEESPIVEAAPELPVALSSFAELEQAAEQHQMEEGSHAPQETSTSVSDSLIEPEIIAHHPTIEPDIITPASLPKTPTEGESNQEQTNVTPPTPSSKNELSLEERFFLDF